MSSGSRVKGLRSRVYDVGFQVQGLGLSVPDSRVKHYWLMVSSLVFRVSGLWCRISGFKLSVRPVQCYTILRYINDAGLLLDTCPPSVRANRAELSLYQITDISDFFSAEIKDVRSKLQNSVGGRGEIPLFFVWGQS